MDTQIKEPVDFRKMYEQATEADDEKAKRILKELYDKMTVLCTTIDGFRPRMSGIINNFLSLKVPSYTDKISWRFIQSKSNKLAQEVDFLIDEARTLFRNELQSIDFSAEENRAELLKPNPYKVEFEAVEEAIKLCNEAINGLQQKLNDIISRNGMARIRLIKRVVKRFIDTALQSSDPVDVYHSILTSEVGRIPFTLAELFDIDSPLKGSVVKLYNINARLHSYIICVIGHNKDFDKEYKANLKDRFEEEIPFVSSYLYHDTDAFFEDFSLMLNHTLMNVDITLKTSHVSETYFHDKDWEKPSDCRYFCYTFEFRLKNEIETSPC